MDEKEVTFSFTFSLMIREWLRGWGGAGLLSLYQWGAEKQQTSGKYTLFSRGKWTDGKNNPSYKLDACTLLLLVSTKEIGFVDFFPTYFRDVPPSLYLQPESQEGGCSQLQGRDHSTDPLPRCFPFHSHCCYLWLESVKHLTASLLGSHRFSALFPRSQDDFVTVLLTILLGSFASSINPTVLIRPPGSPWRGSSLLPPRPCDPHPLWVPGAPD